MSDLLKIRDIKVYVLEAALAEPFAYSQAWYERRGACLVEIVGEDGNSGWGEAFGPARLTAPIIEFYKPLLIGEDALATERHWQTLYNRLRDHGQKGLLIQALSGIDIALWDLKGKHFGVPVHRLLGGKVRDRVPLSWSLAVADADAEIAEVHAKVALGHRIFKIKTAAHPVAGDAERVRRIREAVGPDVALRADANQGWDRPTALRAIRALEPYRLDFVEQPLPKWDLGGMAEIARSVSVPIMADESCCSPHDAMAIARLGGVSILALKLTKSAGILGTMAIARIAEAAGLGCYVGCMIETSLGTAAYLHVALAATPVTWGCELFGPLLLAGDVVRRPVQYADGAILALDGPGLGVEVDERRLKEWTRH